ncbi:uncharacterized protein [Dysidea avara]|uniref:uncharacterized protein isoform X2 n=1 Tax=Dysidea avara TaxID=196820 RepID=UPI00332D98AC
MRFSYLEFVNSHVIVVCNAVIIHQMTDSEAVDPESLPTKRNPTKEEQESLFNAVSHGDLTTIRNLHSSGIDVTGDVDVGEWTALHFAAEKGHYNVASALLQWGANVDATEEYDLRTPLHYAARYGHTDIFNLLVANGADINKQDKNGKTPLVMAANYNKQHHSTKEVEVNSKQYDQVKEEQDEEPPCKKPRLHKEDKVKIETAARNGDVATLQELYSNGVDVTGVVSENGFTGLHWAALRGHYDVTSTLLNCGTNVNVTGGLSKITPLHIAARNGYTDISALLIDNGGDMNLKDEESNSTPLAAAVNNNHSSTVYYLIKEAGLDPTQCDEQLQQRITHLLEKEESDRRVSSDQLAGSSVFKPMVRGGINKRIIIAYHEAMKKGTRASNQMKLVMMGAEGAGKTSTVGSFLGKQFQEDQPPTSGAELNSCTIERIFTSKWRQSEIKDQLEKLPRNFRSGMKTYISTISKNTPVHVDNQVAATGTQEEIPKEVVARVQEVLDTKDVSDGDIRVVILDLGGQEIYYEIHFMFLAPEDVVLMTFDASKGLDEAVISRQRLNRFQEKVAARGMQTNLEVLETLFQSVFSHCGVKVEGGMYISKRAPTIIMIATHSKGLTEQHKRNIMNRFYKAFSGKLFMDHLPASRADAFHFIDNEARDQVIFAKVKDTIIKAGRPVIEKQCPITYLQFETGLLQESEINSTITQKEALNIAINADIEENMLKEALLHFSYKGVLLYYPDVPALQDVVFVNPQEVSNLVSSVISTHNYEPSSAELQLSCDRYDNYGLLEEELLNDMLKSCGRLQQKEVILGLLKKFDLAVEVSVETKFDDEDDSYELPKKGRVFVVPSMLVYNKKKLYQKKVHDVVVLYHFPDKYLPENIFNHLLVKTISWCNKWGHHVRCIYRGTGYFDCKGKGQSFKLQQCQITYSIKCYFTIHAQDEQMMLEQRQELLSYLKESLNVIHQMYIPSARQPIAYLECPLHHDDNCLPHVRLNSINTSNDVFCSKSECQAVPKKAYMLLLTTVSDKGSSSAPVLMSRGSNALFEKVPTLKQLTNIVVPKLAADWKVAAINLDFDSTSIRLIQQKCGINDPESCCLEMLEEWLATDKGKGLKTWNTLLCALKMSKKLTNACSEIESKLAEGCNP